MAACSIGFPLPDSPAFSSDRTGIESAAEIRFIGLSPGSIGLGQVNLVIPDSAAPGDFELNLNIPCDQVSIKCQSSGHASTSVLVPVG